MTNMKNDADRHTIYGSLGFRPMAHMMQAR